MATHIKPVKTEHDVEVALRLQLVLTTVLMVPMMLIAVEWLPSEFTIIGVAKTIVASRMDGTISYFILEYIVYLLILDIIYKAYLKYFQLLF